MKPFSFTSYPSSSPGELPDALLPNEQVIRGTGSSPQPTPPRTITTPLRRSRSGTEDFLKTQISTCRDFAASNTSSPPSDLMLELPQNKVRFETAAPSDQPASQSAITVSTYASHLRSGGLSQKKAPAPGNSLLTDGLKQFEAVTAEHGDNLENLLFLQATNLDPATRIAVDQRVQMLWDKAVQQHSKFEEKDLPELNKQIRVLEDRILQDTGKDIQPLVNAENLNQKIKSAAMLIQGALAVNHEMPELDYVAEYLNKQSIVATPLQDANNQLNEYAAKIAAPMGLSFHREKIVAKAEKLFTQKKSEVDIAENIAPAGIRGEVAKDIKRQLLRSRSVDFKKLGEDIKEVLAEGLEAPPSRDSVVNTALNKASEKHPLFPLLRIALDSAEKIKTQSIDKNARELAEKYREDPGFLSKWKQELEDQHLAVTKALSLLEAKK